MKNQATKSRKPEFSRQYIEHECYSSRPGTRPRPDVQSDFSSVLLPSTYRTTFSFTPAAANMYLEVEGCYQMRQGLWFYLQPVTREWFPVWFVPETDSELSCLLDEIDDSGLAFERGYQGDL